MNRLIAITALAGTLLAGPLSAAGVAQTAPSATNMKGPPNANGFGKHEGIDQSSPATGAAGSEPSNAGGESAASNMHGPPNANGFRK